jgi:hypothetical protein
MPLPVEDEVCRVSNLLDDVTTDRAVVATSMPFVPTGRRKDWSVSAASASAVLMIALGALLMLYCE